MKQRVFAWHGYNLGSHLLCLSGLLPFYISSNHRFKWIGVLLFALLGLGSISTAHAQTLYFEGTNGLNWSDPNSWYPFGIPNGNDVVIDGSITPISYVDGTLTTGNLSINNAGYVFIAGGKTLFVTGDVSNSGDIVISQTTAFSMSGGTVSGAGSILLSGGAGAQLNGTLTQASDHTISGNGEIDAALTNNGTVNANGGNGANGVTLLLQTSNMTNYGTIEVTNNGVFSGQLEVNGITVTQGTNGEILANGGNVQFDAGTKISGGALNTGTNGGTYSLYGSTTFDALTNNSTVYVNNNDTLTVTGDLADNGEISVNPGHYGVDIVSITNGTVSGTGAIILNEGGAYAELNGTLIQSAGHTISGYGQINAALTNNGLVNANVSGGTLAVLGATANNNVMEATNGGVLEIGAITVTQGSNGELLANGGNLQFDNGSAISGGTLNTGANGGTYAVQGNATFDSLTNNSTVYKADMGTLTVTGNLTDNGSIVVNTDFYGGDAISFSGGTVSGTGSIILNEGGGYAVLNGTLTQSAGHTISGNGQINAALTNNGTVNANGGSTYNGSSLVLQTSDMTNNNVMEATNGGQLEVNGITVSQGTNGEILADGGNVQFEGGAKISGGALNTGTNGGYYSLYGNATFDVLTNNSTVYISNNDTLTVTGDLTDNGEILVNGNYYGNDIITVSGGTVSGSGSIVLNVGGAGAQLNGTLTQASGHTITGNGEINAALINNGTVNANGGTTLSVTGATTNNGLMQASNGGTLAIASGVLTNFSGTTLTGGSYEVDANSAINLPGSITTNAATVTLSGANSNFSAINSLTNNQGSFYLKNGRAFATAGDLVNDGLVNIDSTSSLLVNGALSEPNHGTVIVNGTLTGIVTVGSGSFIGGGGTVNGPITVGQGGTSYPGDPKILSATSVEYQDGSTAEFAIATTRDSSQPPTAGVDYDQIDITGNTLDELQIDPGTTTLLFNLEPGTLAALQADAQANIDDYYFLFQLGSGTSIGQFSDLTITDGANTYTEGFINGEATFTQLDLVFDFSYTANESNDSLVGGNDVAFQTFYDPQAAPEPSTWAMLLGGLSLLALWRLRTRSCDGLSRNALDRTPPGCRLTLLTADKVSPRHGPR